MDSISRTLNWNNRQRQKAYDDDNKTNDNGSSGKDSREEGKGDDDK